MKLEYKRQRKPKGKYRMDNPQKLATLGTKNKKNHRKLKR